MATGDSRRGSYDLTTLPSQTFSRLFVDGRAAAALLRMLPLINDNLCPSVIVCKNEELYAAAMLASGEAGALGGEMSSAVQWWASMCCSPLPAALPVAHHARTQQDDLDQRLQEQEPAAFQSRRMHAERRVAAQRKAFQAHSNAILLACEQQQQHSVAVATLASLDAQRLVLLQQYNSLRHEHRAASKAGKLLCNIPPHTPSPPPHPQRSLSASPPLSSLPPPPPPHTTSTTSLLSLQLVQPYALVERRSVSPTAASLLPSYQK